MSLSMHHREVAMHIDSFLHDLAIIMLVAGIVTVIFHRLHQPVVLGYIIAGLILGPHTPPVSFIHDETTVKTLAELGVIFLMFSLGLEFSVRRLLRTGATALIAACAEIVLMILVGFEIGRFFGWRPIDALFLGAMLAISSTTIIIKALDELGMKKEPFAQTIFGILIIEDILAIGILALLSGLAVTGSIHTLGIITTLGKLLVFLVSSLVIGILIVPKLISHVARKHSKEMLLITVLGLCFGFCILVIKLDYSVALGAFLIGAIMAEAREIKQIEKLIMPLTNMFSAIFFVSIGLLVDPKIIVQYAVPIAVITIAVIIGKVFICSFSVFLAGRDGKTALRVGMGLAQIGEFSFIIATLGIKLNVTSAFLYPIIVTVSAITTFLTPWLIKLADPLSISLAKHMPKRISHVFTTYTNWLQTMPYEEKKIHLRRAIKKIILQLFINLILITGIFIVGSYIAHQMADTIFPSTTLPIRKAWIWGLCLTCSMPFLIAIYQKLKGLGLIFADMTNSNKTETQTPHAIAQIIPMACMLGVLLMIVALSASILPPPGLLLFVVSIVIILTAILWRWFIKLHLQLQIALVKNVDHDKIDMKK